MSKAFDKVFGNVNTAATVRDGKQVMREGKTKRDKANGHVPGQSNRRIWDSTDHVWCKA